MNTKLMPEAALYERSLPYLPYLNSLLKVHNIIADGACRKGRAAELMSGTGYLSGLIKTSRPDLMITAMDIDPRYVRYGQEKYPDVAFEEGDVLSWKPVQQLDVAFCTGALHHVEYADQALAIRNIASMLEHSGLLVLSDCYIDDYGTERQRRLAAAKLGDEYLRAAIMKDAPADVLAATAEITRDDVAGVEFKTSIEKRLPLLGHVFPGIKTIKMWPDAKVGGYGDYIHVWQA